MILFISDLHLSPERPQIQEAFCQFLENTAKGADALYILGDFFNFWLGDDDDTPAHQQTIQALNHYQQSGTAVYFMVGNRDFLVSKSLAEQMGATLLEEPVTITLNGQQTLLLHGDSLCTKDEEYMQFRQMVRGEQWQKEVLNKSLAERKALAEQLRSNSQTMNSLKSEDIMDVTPEAVVDIMQAENCTTLIHGHTHRPARHAVKLNNHTGERIVLGDWGKLGWYLKADGENLELCSFAIDETD
jgi:UDP-2,3-diacylglucosamine hydrolase